MSGASAALIALIAIAAVRLSDAAEPIPIAPGSGTAIGGMPTGPQGSSWQSIAKLPDFSTGIWLGKMAPSDASSAATPPVLQDNRNCAPDSMPGVMGGPLALEFLFTPGRVTVALEAERAIRRVYLQPKHSDDPDYTFMGESIGHWESGTLVIDTIAIKSVHGAPPTHIVERVSLVGQDQLQVEQTLYYGAHSSRRVRNYERRRNERIMEYYCEENPRDRFDAGGHASVDTTQK